MINEPTAQRLMVTAFKSDWGIPIEQAVRSFVAVCAMIYTAGLMAGEFIHWLNDVIAGKQPIIEPVAPAPAPVVVVTAPRRGRGRPRKS